MPDGFSVGGKFGELEEGVVEAGQGGNAREEGEVSEGELSRFASLPSFLRFDVVTHERTASPSLPQIRCRPPIRVANLAAPTPEGECDEPFNVKAEVEADELIDEGVAAAETILFLPGPPNPVLTGVPPVSDGDGDGDPVLELLAMESVEVDLEKEGGGPDPREEGAWLGSVSAR